MTPSAHRFRLVVLLSLVFFSMSTTGCCGKARRGDMRHWEQLVALAEVEPEDRRVRIYTKRGEEKLALLSIETRVIAEGGRSSPWFRPIEAAAYAEAIAVAISADRVVVFRKNEVLAVQLRGSKCTEMQRGVLHLLKVPLLCGALLGVPGALLFPVIL